MTILDLLCVLGVFALHYGAYMALRTRHDRPSGATPRPLSALAGRGRRRG